MANDSRNTAQLHDALLSTVGKLLPPAVRDRYMTSLKELRLAPGDWVAQYLATLAGGYREQIVLAFDAVAFVLLIAGVWYCFSAVPLPLPLGIIEGGTLTALIF